MAKGKRDYKVDASAKPNTAPLYSPKGYGQGSEALPTIYFAIDVNLSDEAFEHASRVIADINLGAGNYAVASVEVAPLLTDE